jgi:hypothetical protein
MNYVPAAIVIGLLIAGLVLLARAIRLEAKN